MKVLSDIHPPVLGNQLAVVWVGATNFLSSEFNTTYMENMGLSSLPPILSKQGPSSTTSLWLGCLPKGCDGSQQLYLYVCTCLHVSVSALACVCLCACSRPHVPVCPASIGLTLYSIPQGGPALCASGECQGEGTELQMLLMDILAATRWKRSEGKVWKGLSLVGVLPLL